jgi:4-hydroxy-3-methylbut-2-enyl diphosphate reductase
MPRIVHGAARARLASTGALAVDMEAAQLAAVAGNRPFAVLRAIVDTPDAPLLRPATLSRGLRGLRALRVAAPAIEQWTAALGRRELVILAARGVAPQMRRGAMARGLRVVDATRRDEICYATTNRQQAVRSIAAEADLVLVVGSRHSSNSLRLVEVAERLGTPAYLVDGVEDVDLAWLAGASTVGITAGASAPENLVEQIITSLSGLGPVSVRESDVVHEDVEFTLPKEVI